jgi:hypothetical protein
MVEALPYGKPARAIFEKQMQSLDEHFERKGICVCYSAGHEQLTMK